LADQLYYDNWRIRNLQLNTRLFTGERMRAMIDASVAYRAEVLWAFPSHLEMLCRYIEETGDNRFRPRVIVTNAEVLYDAQRAKARRLLGCDVFDWYGLAEHAAAAAECEQHGYHVPEEVVAVEIVSGAGEPPVGEPGDIIGTSLENYAQPFIRYRTGDYASWREGPCPCGRSHRMLKEIGGRTQDVITTPDGICTFRHGALALEGIPGLEAVQIEQCEVRRFVVRAVAPRGLSDEAKRGVAASVVRALGFEASVSVVEVREIPRTERGKHQLVVSRVPFSFAR
jgi:phenylacetate-CoA ligase